MDFGEKFWARYVSYYRLASAADLAQEQSPEATTLSLYLAAPDLLRRDALLFWLTTVAE